MVRNVTISTFTVLHNGPHNPGMKYLRRAFVAVVWVTAAILLARGRTAADPVTRLRDLGGI
ncbi:MAG: hypothetical protein JO041_08410 [Acidobacteria bacterium]|nr:hypothetical protein [Acidobacteriota bacterium]